MSQCTWWKETVAMHKSSHPHRKTDFGVAILKNVCKLCTLKPTSRSKQFFRHNFVMIMNGNRQQSKLIIHIFPALHSNEHRSRMLRTLRAPFRNKYPGKWKGARDIHYLETLKHWSCTKHNSNKSSTNSFVKCIGSSIAFIDSSVAYTCHR